MSPLIWVMTIVILLITPLTTNHELPRRLRSERVQLTEMWRSCDRMPATGVRAEDFRMYCRPLTIKHIS